MSDNMLRQRTFVVWALVSSGWSLAGEFDNYEEAIEKIKSYYDNLTSIYPSKVMLTEKIFYDLEIKPNIRTDY